MKQVANCFLMANKPGSQKEYIWHQNQNRINSCTFNPSA